MVVQGIGDLPVIALELAPQQFQSRAEQLLGLSRPSRLEDRACQVGRGGGQGLQIDRSRVACEPERRRKNPFGDRLITQVQIGQPEGGTQRQFHDRALAELPFLDADARLVEDLLEQRLVAAASRFGLHALEHVLKHPQHLLGRFSLILRFMSCQFSLGPSRFGTKEAEGGAGNTRDEQEPTGGCRKHRGPVASHEFSDAVARAGWGCQHRLA